MSAEPVLAERFVLAIPTHFEASVIAFLTIFTYPGFFFGGLGHLAGYNGCSLLKIAIIVNPKFYAGIRKSQIAAAGGAVLIFQKAINAVQFQNILN